MLAPVAGPGYLRAGHIAGLNHRCNAMPPEHSDRPDEPDADASPGKAHPSERITAEVGGLEAMLKVRSKPADPLGLQDETDEEAPGESG